MKQNALKSATGVMTSNSKLLRHSPPPPALTILFTLSCILAESLCNVLFPRLESKTEAEL